MKCSVVFWMVPFCILFSCQTSVDADIVIDNFSNGTTISTNPIIGPLSSSSALDDDVSGDKTFTIADPVFAQFITSPVGNTAYTSAGVGGTLQLEYTNLPSLNLFSSPTPTLRIDLFDTVAGSFDLSVTYGSSGTFTTQTMTLSSSRDSIGIQGSNFANTAVASAVDTIILDLEVLSLDGGVASAIVNNGTGSITAVPELSSMTLLGMTCAGGFGYMRRRKKKKHQQEQENTDV